MSGHLTDSQRRKSADVLVTTMKIHDAQKYGKITEAQAEKLLEKLRNGGITSVQANNELLALQNSNASS